MTERFFRKVIRIKATDSPNVRWAMNEERLGRVPAGEVVLPGVLPWNDYRKRLATWDPIRICIGLEADWYEGAEVLLFPPAWLNRAERYHLTLRGYPRRAKAIGIDPAEGGDKTAMAAGDEYGLIELVSKKTPDTAVIRREALAFMRKHGVPPEMVMFDRGGGGKQIADEMRADGHHVRTVGFGETLTLDPKRGLRLLQEKLGIREEHYEYVNRRAEMYFRLRLRIDPARADLKGNELAYALPGGEFGEVYAELRRQLAPIPLLYDREGRYRLLPKHKNSPDSEERNLTELIGHSPDEADAVVLMLHAMDNKPTRRQAGAIH